MATLRLQVLIAAILVLTTASAVPTNQPAPQDVRDYYQSLGSEEPGEKCHKLAMEQYSAVLTDAVNRQDHLALALAYDAFAEANLAC